MILHSDGGLPLLGGEDAEVRVRLDELLRVWDEELAVIVEKTVEGLKHLSRGKVQLVKHNPRASTQSLLESLGFEWSARRATWERRILPALRCYHGLHGHLEVRE